MNKVSIFLTCIVLLTFAGEVSADGLVHKKTLERPMIQDCNVPHKFFGGAVALGDLNGDGFDDIIIGGSSTGTGQQSIYIYYSAENDKYSILENSIEIEDVNYEDINTADVNGDGFKDIIVKSVRIIKVFHGKSTKLTSTDSADWEYQHPDILYVADEFIEDVGVLDINVDGIDDIIVSVPIVGKAYIFYGSESGLPADHEPDAIIYDRNEMDKLSQYDYEYNKFVSYLLSGLDPVSKGGYNCKKTFHPDPGNRLNMSNFTINCTQQFALGFPGAGIDLDNNGYIWGSGEGPMGAVLIGPSYQILSGDKETLTEFGYRLGHAGDVNGDGKTDLIISAAARINPYIGNVDPKVFVYLGNSNIKTYNDDYAWAVEETQVRYPDSVLYRTFGKVVGSAGDVNGDGYGDIFITDSRYNNYGSNRSQSEYGFWGKAYIWFGGPSGNNDPSGLGANPTPDTADIKISGNFANGGFGSSVAVGDINGDGFSDMVIGDPRALVSCYGAPQYIEGGDVDVYLSDYANADLSINKIDDPDPVTVNRTLTYKINVNNSGPDNATYVVLTDDLPPGMTFEYANASQGACEYDTYSSSVVCRLGRIASMGSAMVNITVIPTIRGTLYNEATVNAFTNDPNMDNNTATTTTTVNRWLIRGWQRFLKNFSIKANPFFILNYS